MLVIGGAMLGAVVGAYTAKKRGGKALDMAQYGAGYGIAFALLGLVATIGLDRFVV
jgi:cytochrome c biogenesis protein CcdA